MPARRISPGTTSTSNKHTVVSNDSNTNSSHEGKKPIKTSESNLPYTVEERTFLNCLQVFSSSSTVIAENLVMLKETWSSGAALDMLTSITEKLLRVAAERFEAEQHNSRKSTATSSSHMGGGKGGNDSSDPIHEEDSVKSCGGSGFNPTTASAAMTICGVSSFSAPLTPTQFEEENAYIVEQLREILDCPFTIQRLLEILVDPFKHYGSAKDGGLRAEALQKAIRRCVMVTYPFTGSDNDSEDHKNEGSNNMQSATESGETTTTTPTTTIPTLTNK